MVEKKKDVLEGLFLPYGTKCLIDTDQWNKLITVLESHKRAIEYNKKEIDKLKGGIKNGKGI